MALYQPFDNKDRYKYKKRWFEKKGYLLCIIFIISLIWKWRGLFVSESHQSNAKLSISKTKEIDPRFFSRISTDTQEAEDPPGTEEMEYERSEESALTPSLKKENFRMIKGALERGDTVYKFLLNNNITKETIHTIIKELEPIVSLRAAMPGDVLALTLDAKENIHRFEYKSGPTETYILERDPNGRLDSFRQKVILQKYWAAVSGKVNGSLFNSIVATGEDTGLAGKFADIFAWKIDFHNEPRKDDKFKFLVEKYYLEGKFIKYGNIMAAEYNGYCGLHQAIFFEDESGHGDYYDLNGISLRRAFLRAPLRFNYISSGYSYHRRHPILGYVRPHLGIDYAAPQGTPVWSVADGIVLSAKYEGGNGNQVIIKHMNGYQTYYNHLSSFAKGIKNNARIKQQQVIGYVGTTGLSTGPHLDYRVKHSREFINPLKENFPTGQKIEASSKKAFHQTAYNFLHFMYDNQR